MKLPQLWLQGHVGPKKRHVQWKPSYLAMDVVADDDHSRVLYRLHEVVWLNVVFWWKVWVKS